MTDNKIDLLPDEQVNVVFVTSNNFINAYMPRQDASDMMRRFFAFRDAFTKMGWFRRLWTKVQCLFWESAFAYNYGRKDQPGVTYASVVVDWKYVIGIYIREMVKSPQELLTEAQLESIKEHTEMMRRMHKDGEEWKGDNEGD